MSQLIYAADNVRIDHLGKKSGAVAVKRVSPLVPNSFPWMRTLSRQLKTKVENSLYLYVLQFDKFPTR
jgi:hypothetical protein